MAPTIPPTSLDYNEWTYRTITQFCSTFSLSEALVAHTFVCSSCTTPSFKCNFFFSSMPSYMTLAVLALAASTVSPALSVPLAVKPIRGQTRSLSHRGLFSPQLIEKLTNLAKKIIPHKAKPAPRPPPAAPELEGNPSQAIQVYSPGRPQVHEPVPSRPEEPDPVPSVPARTWKSKLKGAALDFGIGAAGTVAGDEILKARPLPGNSTTGPANSTDPSSSNSTNPSSSNSNNPSSGTPNNPSSCTPNNPWSCGASNLYSSNPSNLYSSDSTNPNNPNNGPLQERALVHGEEALSLSGRTLDELC